MTNRERLAMSRPTEGAAGKTRDLAGIPPGCDREKCNACGLCATSCPDAAIDEELNVDLGFCKGCGICANECPKKAIAMTREEK